MEKLVQKENDISLSNKQSTLDTNKNSILFYNNGNYFSFGKDNTISNKFAPNTSTFNIKETLKKPIGNTNTNNNTFLNKKRKLMTSEELELEQIERERKEVKKMMQKNMALYYRTKSGTTTIVSKIKENIYNTGNNNINKNAILNNYINNNKLNFSGNNSYALNFMKEKGIIKNPEMQKPIVPNNNNIVNETIIVPQPPQEKAVDIINTDINKNNNNNNNNEVSVEDKIQNNNEKEENDNIIQKDNDVIEEKENKIIENESEIKITENGDSNIPLKEKTPNKESSYMTKVKKLGSMSKLDLCNKIQKYTEVCQEVLKEQNGEGFTEEKEKKGKNKKGQKGKKKKK